MNNRIARHTVALFGLSLLWTACSSNGDDDNEPKTTDSESDISETYTVGSFTINAHYAGLGQNPALSVTHAENPDKILWQTPDDLLFVRAAIGEAEITEERGSFQINDEIQTLCDSPLVESVALETVEGENALVIRGVLSGEGCNLTFSLSFKPESEKQLGFTLALDDTAVGFNRVFFRYASNAEERFFGFGEQFTYLDMKGRLLPIYSQEQGIGRGSPGITEAMDAIYPGVGGTWFSTYAAVPHYLTNQQRSLFLENYEVSFFDLQAPDTVEIKLFGKVLKGRILYGADPLELIEEYTSYCGRMAPLPDWIMDGALVGMQGGTQAVEEKLAALESRDTPIGAFWLQDWVGKRTTVFGSQLWWSWELDENRYPGWSDLVAGLTAKGIRVMTYINPYLVDVSEQPSKQNFYQEAIDNGYFVLNEQGSVYEITNTDFNAGIVDLTNPASRTWFKNIIRDNVLGVGASGWMADFAEALPFDAVLSSGEAAALYHNAFPEEWARLNREVLTELNLLEDTVFFSRSAYTKSPGLTRLFWLGDQLVDWDEHDGLKSGIKGLLSGGLSGFSLNHSDIGGYTTFILGTLNYTRSKELLLRWMEANAFTAVFRTHEGNRPEDNTQFYTDEETYDHFALIAKVYKALADYRKELMQEAFEHGYPLVRHPMLHYPDDPAVYDLEYQWMLGSEFMVAPIVEQGKVANRVYLPAGEWVHVWSGTVIGTTDAGAWYDITDAPLGKPPVFYKKGSVAGEHFVAELKTLGVL